MAEAARKRSAPETLLVSEDVLVRLKADILDGRFAPGTKLPFAQLQRDYGAGIGTLREALSALRSEGLVELDAGRGFRVAPVSAADLREVSALHIEFERRAVAESVRCGDEAWELALVTAFHRLQRVEALAREERLRRSSEWLACHREFHRALVAGCPNRWLLNLRALMYDHMERYRLLSQRHRPPGPPKRREHALIRDAALARKPEEAAALLARHLEETTETVLRHAPQFLGGQ